MKIHRLEIWQSRNRESLKKFFPSTSRKLNCVNNVLKALHVMTYDLILKMPNERKIWKFQENEKLLFIFFAGKTHFSIYILINHSLYKLNPFYPRFNKFKYNKLINLSLVLLKCKAFSKNIHCKRKIFRNHMRLLFCKYIY